jgi:hypothetical protein
LSIDIGYRKKSMLIRTIASYIEKNINLKIGAQRVMLVDTNETIIVRRLRMTPTKRAIKGNGERGKMPLLTRTLKGLKREKFPLL